MNKFKLLELAQEFVYSHIINSDDFVFVSEDYTLQASASISYEPSEFGANVEIKINLDSITHGAKEKGLSVVSLLYAVLAHEMGHYIEYNEWGYRKPRNTIQDQYKAEQRAYSYGKQFVKDEFKNEYIFLNELNLNEYRKEMGHNEITLTW